MKYLIFDSNIFEVIGEFEDDKAVVDRFKVIFHDIDTGLFVADETSELYKDFHNKEEE